MNRYRLSSLVVATIASVAFGGLVAGERVSSSGYQSYQISDVLIPDDQPVKKCLKPRPIYKPHEVVIDPLRRFLIASNDRGNETGGFGGITVLREGSNKVSAFINIDEPRVLFHAEEEDETGYLTAPEEPDPNFEPEQRFNPTVCLPVRLYPGSEPPAFVDEQTGVTYNLANWNGDPRYVCAPLGAEQHARHPHGIDMDRHRGLVYQVIEHSGLKWNAKRNGFAIAQTTDEESGMLVVYDVRNPRNPKIVDGFLLGHGAHEVAVNDRNGKVFQGNHEDSPGVEPKIWVDVIDRKAHNPYGFIDTGFYNAVQGIEVDERLNQVFGTAHVGELMFALRGDCVPKPNAKPTVVNFNGVPFVEKRSGRNCILYSVDLRKPFLKQIPEGKKALTIADSLLEQELALPAVLYMHDLTVDDVNHIAYQTLHSIHHAAHTGSPEEAALIEKLSEENNGEEPPEVEEVPHHFMARWVAAVDVNPRSKRFRKVTYIDLSNGQSVLDVPNADDVPPETPYEKRFVHAHWVAVDGKRENLLVTGEHTGNLGVVDTDDGDLEQVIGITRSIPGCVPPVDEIGLPEAEEPHVHGVQVNPLNAIAYVTDEGEHCFYESVTVLELRDGKDDDGRGDEGKDDDRARRTR
jgi:hypothetical protein